jgi:hypothetical protein
VEGPSLIHGKAKVFSSSERQDIFWDLSNFQSNVYQTLFLRELKWLKRESDE